MSRVYRGILALVLIAQWGCGAIQEPAWNKPFGRGAIIPAAVCAVIGAGGGAAVQEFRTGTSTATVDGQVVSRTEDDPEHWKGALIGAAAGTVICGVLGHIFLDEPYRPTGEEVTPAGAALPPGGVAVKTKTRIVLRGVFFDFDKFDIRPDSRPVLDEAAVLLRERQGEIQMLVVEGHTDAIGTDAYNQALSIRRAEAVYRYLVNKGVPPEIMRTEGYGESRPVADNETESGRAQNRRVELRVIPIGGEPAAQEQPKSGEPAAEGR